ncbi:MAG: hypothetical protein JW908_05415 [Anaerolineales bacterium]|nr:hypothetical protein [Anaerolineales bacterium]
MNSILQNNPLDFTCDLDELKQVEMDIYTQIARRRLLERPTSIAELKKGLFEGETQTRPPLLIADFPSRLIGINPRDYYVDTIKHYQAYCAALARFGEDYVFPYTCTWEYRFVEALGGQLAFLPDKAPETKVYPINSLDDLKSAPTVNLELFLDKDLALKRYVDNRLGDLIGPGCFVILDPFSSICSLLRDPQKLMRDIIQQPEFVDALCEYSYKLVREVMRLVLNSGPTVFFMPGYLLMISPRHFERFARPYIDRLVDDFPGVPIILGSGGNANHLIEPLMKSKIPIVFIDAASNLDMAVEKAAQYDKPFTVLFPRSILMKGQKQEIFAYTRKLFQKIENLPIYYWTEAILGGDIPNYAIDAFIQAYYEIAGTNQIAQISVEQDIDSIPESIDVNDIIWEEKAEKALNQSVPFMFRKMVRNEVTKKAAAEGISIVTREYFENMKKQAGY